MTSISKYIALFTISYYLIGLGCTHQSKDLPIPTAKKAKKLKPLPGFLQQRIAGVDGVNYARYEAALEQALLDRTINKEKKDLPEWQSLGPLNIGGRVTDIAIHPQDEQTIYVAGASGGVFKLTEMGEQMTPIFDEQKSLSIGDIAIAPSNKNILYVGTGEANAGGGSITYDGIGIFKSTNAGETWSHIGLDNTRNIGRIVVDPKDPNRVYVGAMGSLFKDNPERGVFRSVDGGETWEHVLGLTDSTGCIDLIVHPTQANILYASMWERVRRPDRRKYGGASCGLYRSKDGGTTWEEMTNGLPQSDLGRIGISQCKAQPNILYAIYADESGDFKGIFKTTNGGKKWFQIYDKQLTQMYASYGWWFGNIRVDPHDPDVIYALGLDVYKSEDGGLSWQNISQNAVHYDQHAMQILESNPQIAFLGNDGGLYMTQNGGEEWLHYPYLPITQFYTCKFHPTDSNQLFGGSQDNGVLRSVSIKDQQWNMMHDGDGMEVLVDPNNPKLVYASYQYGQFSRSLDGGEQFIDATWGIAEEDPKNWNTPVVMDPVNSQVFYYGTNRLYRSENGAASWQVISPPFTKTYQNNGSILSSSIVYGTITTIAIAANNNQVIYIGTDDGQVFASFDGGVGWTDVGTHLPNKWVSRIAIDPTDYKKVYLSFSGYRKADEGAYVFQSQDNGQHWTDITNNLPQAPVNDLLIDPQQPNILYIATDVGVYQGDIHQQKWQLLGNGLPIVPVTDLDLHKASRKLAAATYGRSIYQLDLP